jgi:hypothetical protein
MKVSGNCKEEAEKDFVWRRGDGEEIKTGDRHRGNGHRVLNVSQKYDNGSGRRRVRGGRRVGVVG